METVAFAELISYLTYLCQMSSGGFTRKEMKSIKRHVTNSTARIDLRPLFSAMTDHRKIEATSAPGTTTTNARLPSGAGIGTVNQPARIRI